MQQLISMLAITFTLIGLTGCQPITQIVRGEGTASAPVETLTTASDERPMIVEAVEVQVGVGSPIPVDIFVSGTWPDLCAQLTESRQEISGFAVELTILTTPLDPTCPPDRLGVPFRVALPLNTVQLPAGDYTITVNGKWTSFAWDPANPNPVNP